MVTPQWLAANAAARGNGIAEAVRTEAKKPAQLAIEVDALAADGKVQGHVRLRQLDEARALAPSVRISVVLFQRASVTECKAGENQGVTLREYFGVLALHEPIDPASALAKEGTAFAFDKPAEAEGLGVAVLVEDTAAMKTLECRAIDVAKQ